MKTKQVPLPIEAWVDVILASAAHRSSNIGQQRFGEQLIERYFTAVPDRFREDEAASAYFDEMIPAVASTIRAFSVARDIFQTQTASMEALKEISLNHLQHMEALAPTSKSGLWGKGIAVLGAVGLVAPLHKALLATYTNVDLAWLLAIGAALALSIIALEILIHTLQAAQARRIESAFPSTLASTWRDEAMTQYRSILAKYIPRAIQITNRHFPENKVSELSEEQVLELIERQLAF